MGNGDGKLGIEESGGGFSDVIEGALGEVFNASLFADRLEALAIDDPNKVKGLLMQWGKNVENYVDEDGGIETGKLSRELATGLKIKMLISFWLGDLFGDYIDEKIPKMKDFKIRDFSQELASLKDKVKSIYIDRRNIVWKSGGVLDVIRSSLGIVEHIRDKEDGDAPYLVRKSRIILGREGGGQPGIMPSKFSVYRRAIGKLGINLSLADVNKAIKTPGENEIQVVYVPKEGLPMKSDGKVDVKTMRWYAELYESGENIWYMSSDLLAGIYRVLGESKDEALNRAGMGKLKPAFAAQFNLLDKQLKGSEKKDDAKKAAEEEEDGPEDEGDGAEEEAAEESTG